MSNMLTNEFHDEMVLVNHYYPDVVPVQGSQEKQRTRRKKSSNTGFKKRKLSDEQANMLELHFQSEHKLDSERKDRLASHLGLDPRQVAVWFQNRRARWKSKKLEEEYLRLKTEHDCTLSEKCLLTTELLKLKQRLSETEKEKQKLLQQSNSPSSSISAGVTEPPFVAEFGLDTMFCVTQNNYDYDAHGFDSWPNLYDMQLY